jgi:branched-chain amino acid transport system substrate-binding protein
VAVEELIAEGAEALVLVCSGDLALAAAPTFDAAQVPAATLCASQPEVQDIGGPFLFGNVFGDNAQAVVSAEYAVENELNTAFVLSSPDNVFVDGMPKYWSEAFESFGGEVIGNATYSLGQSDFSAVVTQIRNLDPQPDVIMTAAFEPDFPAFLRQLRGAGVEIPIIGADGLDSPTTLELGDVANGVVYTSIGIPTPGSSVEKFYQDYEAHFGEPPLSFYAPAGYDLIKVLEAAVMEAGSTDPVAIRDAWDSLEDIQGATGSITYLGMDRTPLKPVSLVRIQDGEFELLELVTPDPSTLPIPFSQR